MNLIEEYLHKKITDVSANTYTEHTIDVPQKSALDPILWSIKYDGIMRIHTNKCIYRRPGIISKCRIERNLQTKSE